MGVKISLPLLNNQTSDANVEMTIFLKYSECVSYPIVT